MQANISGFAGMFDPTLFAAALGLRTKKIGVGARLLVWMIVYAFVCAFEDIEPSLCLAIIRLMQHCVMLELLCMLYNLVAHLLRDLAPLRDRVTDAVGERMRVRVDEMWMALSEAGNTNGMPYNMKRRIVAVRQHSTVRYVHAPAKGMHLESMQRLSRELAEEVVSTYEPLPASVINAMKLD